MSDPDIRVEDSWVRLLRELREADACGRVFVLGTAGSGKTTLCRYLGRELAQSARTAAIDCDPGQSAIGPPTSLGFAWEPWKAEEAPAALRFVGSTSPARHFLQTVTGVRRLVDRAFEDGAKRVVLDASGYASNLAGREFQFQLLDLVAPDHLVAIQRTDELEELLVSFARRRGTRLHRLPVARSVVHRNREDRREYREKKFQQYFGDAASRELGYFGLGFHGMLPALTDPSSYQNRLLALHDRDGFVAVLSILEDVDFDRGKFTPYSPPFDRARLGSIQFGSIKLERSGRELPG